MIDHNKVRGETVYRRTYSRPLNDEGTKFEEWEDTIHRVIEHQRWLWERAKDSGLDETEFTELEGLRILLLSRRASLSGRTLWLGGTDTAKRREASQFNCAGLTLKTINDAVDQIWLLMQGAGVGFHPEVGILNGFTSEIKTIEVIKSILTETAKDVDNNEETYINGVWTIKVGDSAEAWAKSFGKLLAGKYRADKLVFDFSNIRPAGERLKGYGWISSGDSSLAEALTAIAGILNKRAGKLLTRIDLLDVGNWMGTVLSSRRSAEIAFHRFGDPEWEEFAKAKSNIAEDGNIQRYQSNNSLLFYNKPSKLELRGIFEMMVESGGCLPKWSKVLTPEGIRELDNIEAGSIIWSSEGWTTVKSKWSTGVKEVIGYHTKSGTFYSTKNHRVISDSEYNKLPVEDSEVLMTLQGETSEIEDSLDPKYILEGLLIGDGSNRHNKCILYISDKDLDYFDSEVSKLIVDRVQTRDPAYSVITALDPDYLVPLPEREIPRHIMEGDTLTIRSFLRGLFSANGTTYVNINKGSKLSLSLTSVKMREQVLLLLSSIGIQGNYITKEASSRSIKNRYGDNTTFYAKESYEIRVTAHRAKFLALIGFLQKYKQENLIAMQPINKSKPKNLKDILEEEVVSIEEVFDIEVDNDSHTFWCDGFNISNSEPGFINAEEALRRAVWFRLLNPCAEILLGDASFCNLVELNLSAFNGDRHGLREAQYLIGRANYRQTCVNLKDGVLQDTWHELNQFLRLTGMGVTGIVDWEHVGNAEAWRELRQEACDAVHSMADDLNLPRSKAVTTIKPSGTLSKMMGCKEGIHEAMGKYIFNNIIFSKSDPLVPILTEANYAIMEHPHDSQSVVVTFPVVWEGSNFTKITKEGRDLEVNLDSAIVQLERYKMVMQNYVDHNCSITVSYEVKEIPEIVDWLFDNWNDYVGVSWLFRVDPTTTAEDIGYPYLPQEVKTKVEWENYVENIKSFSFKNTETLEELDGTEECVGGVCPVK